MANKSNKKELQLILNFEVKETFKTPPCAQPWLLLREPHSLHGPQCAKPFGFDRAVCRFTKKRKVVELVHNFLDFVGQAHNFLERNSAVLMRNQR